jgi:hypothetical protein
MLHERVEASFFDSDLRLAVGVIVSALLDLLIQHLEKVLLTRGNIPAAREEGDETRADNGWAFIGE